MNLKEHCDHALAQVKVIRETMIQGVTSRLEDRLTGTGESWAVVHIPGSQDLEVCRQLEGMLIMFKVGMLGDNDTFTVRSAVASGPRKNPVAVVEVKLLVETAFARLQSVLREEGV